MSFFDIFCMFHDVFGSCNFMFAVFRLLFPIFLHLLASRELVGCMGSGLECLYSVHACIRVAQNKQNKSENLRHVCTFDQALGVQLIRGCG